MLLSKATNGVYKFIAFSAQMVHTHTWNGKCSDYDNQWYEPKNSLHVFYLFKSECPPLYLPLSIALFRVLVFPGIVENHCYVFDRIGELRFCNQRMTAALHHKDCYS